MPPIQQPKSAPGALPVTVIVPAYNRPAMTRRAVLSAFAQQPLPPAEVLVVDDCSTDDTAEVAARAGARVIRHEVNQGEGAARNTALRHARHDWVALLDSDDEWLANHLASLWPFRDGRVLLAGSALRRRPDGGHRFMGPVTRRMSQIQSPADIAISRHVVASGVMIRRDVALEVGAFRPLPRAADLDLWLRVLERGPGYASPVVSVLYHEHPGQVSDDAARLQQAAGAVLADFQDRPWMTPSVLDGWESVMTWDAFRTAMREGDRRRALKHLLSLLIRPKRSAPVWRMLGWRWRERRRSGRFTAEGRPSVALLSSDAPAARNVSERFGVEPRIVHHGRPAAYIALARRPAGMLVVVGNPLDRIVARALEMRPVSSQRDPHGPTGPLTWARRTVGTLTAMRRPLARDYCSICDRPTRRRAFGDPPRARAQCRACGSLERHRALWSWLEPQLRPGLRILHSAPEEAIYSKLRARSDVQYVTTELDPEAHARDADMVQADIQELPFEDASFDLVICSHVLEHVPDDLQAMREIRRILSPDGVAAIQVPIFDRDLTYEDPSITTPEGRYRAFGQIDHVRAYGRDFDGRLRDAGFETTVISVGRPAGLVHVARPAA